MGLIQNHTKEAYVAGYSKALSACKKVIEMKGIVEYEDIEKIEDALSQAMGLVDDINSSTT